jgi:nitroreductase
MEKNAIECIMTRTSVRHFTGETVSQDALLTMVKAGMAAPSAVNVQPWSFIVVTERATLDKLCAVLSYAKMLAKAGAAIIACGLPAKDATVAPKFWVIDCTAASENILLAAHALGYGALWTAVYPDDVKIAAVRSILHIPDGVIPLNVIPVGVPVPRADSVKDKFDKNNLHHEQW